MQEDLFKVAGTPMVENCMLGYNSSMFAYGQTGSGKTYTMLGDIDDLAYRPSHQRGMTPRIFEYLFARIHQVSMVFRNGGIFSNFPVSCVFCSKNSSRSSISHKSEVRTRF